MATLEKRDLSGRSRRETIALDTDGAIAPAVTAVGIQSVRALRNIIDGPRDPVVKYASWPGHGCYRLREYTDFVLPFWVSRLRDATRYGRDR